MCIFYQKITSYSSYQIYPCFPPLLLDITYLSIIHNPFLMFSSCFPSDVAFSHTFKEQKRLHFPLPIYFKSLIISVLLFLRSCVCRHLYLASLSSFLIRWFFLFTFPVHTPPIQCPFPAQFRFVLPVMFSPQRLRSVSIVKLPA